MFLAITGIVVRRRVPNLDAAVPFYEALTGSVANRFAFGDAELAAVGPFLLFTAPADAGDKLEAVATITVDDIVEQTRLLRSIGADIVAPAAPTPNGRAWWRVTRTAASSSTSAGEQSRPVKPKPVNAWA